MAYQGFRFFECTPAELDRIMSEQKYLFVRRVPGELELSAGSRLYETVRQVSVSMEVCDVFGEPNRLIVGVLNADYSKDIGQTTELIRRAGTADIFVADSHRVSHTGDYPVLYQSLRGMISNIEGQLAQHLRAFIEVSFRSAEGYKLDLPRIISNSAISRRDAILIQYSSSGGGMILQYDEHYVHDSLSNAQRRFQELLDRISELGARTYTLLVHDASVHSLATQSRGSQIALVDITARILPLLREDPDRLLKLSDNQFEDLVAERFMTMGFNVRQCGKTRAKDGGLDMLAVPQHSPMPYILGIQVKHHSDPTSKTGVNAVNQVLSVVRNRSPLLIGMLVTNTTFTRNAFWAAVNALDPIHLRGFDSLARWLRDDFEFSPDDLVPLPEALTLAPGITIPIPWKEGK